MVVLVLGIMTAHVPFPVLARKSSDDCDRSESCGACERDPNGFVARQVSSGEPEAASLLKHSARESPDGEPCCPNGCTHCALPCCGSVLVIAPSAASQDFPSATSIAPVAISIFSTIEITDVFHPPRA